MISRFFSRRRASGTRSGSAPDGERIYAIGDIHGRFDLLEQLILQIDRDDASRGPADTKIIFLGDLIDRGPASVAVIDLAMQLARERGNCRFLLGNHEEVFLKAVSGDLKALAFFTRIGGRETILSYGISPEEYRASDYPELLEMLQARVPADHLAFLQGFEDLIVANDYAFVHAGVRPGVALLEQRASDLRWIRDEFLDFDGTLEKIVVHGHTISEDVEDFPHRIGIDTGAYASGRLTAMGFEADRRWVLQTSA